MYLRIILRYPADRYHGYEWPPSPARVFQALVAGAAGSLGRTWPLEAIAPLKWLETLPAPHIFSRPGRPATAYRLFVPNNSLDRRAAKNTKTEKPFAPTILCGHRLGEPDVIYAWPVEDTPETRRHAEGLDRLAARLRAVGLGIDFVSATADLVETVEPPLEFEAWIPDERGALSLTTPKPGFFEHLSDSYAVFRTRISPEGLRSDTRPADIGRARYRLGGAARPRRWLVFELRDLQERLYAVPWEQTQVVAAWLRHAAAEALRQEEISEDFINSYVLGHVEHGDPGHRLSFVPLPSVGHQYSDGCVRRVLIVEPPSAIGSDAETLDLLGAKLPGWPLTAPGEKNARAFLVSGSAVGPVLPFYLRSGKVWSTVTPVILHGHNAVRREVSLQKTQRLLNQCLAAAGYPIGVLSHIAFQPAPFWPGCGASFKMEVPLHLRRWPRLHVQLEFQEPVAGPLLAGLGRHYGIGVFACKLST